MFKRIEIWILYLILLLGIPITIGFGSLVNIELQKGTKLGSLSKTALFLSEIPFSISKIFNSKLIVRDRFSGLDGFNGKSNLNESYLLFSRYDGDLNEGIVELVDLTNFKVLHTWNPNIDQFNRSVENVGEFK